MLGILATCWMLVAAFAATDVSIHSGAIPSRYRVDSSDYVDAPSVLTSDFGQPSCVVGANAQTLRAHLLAFDGTVEKIEPAASDEIIDGLGTITARFRVHQWFKGGKGDFVTLEFIGPNETEDPDMRVVWTDGPVLDVGDRVLATGGGGRLAVACGFTQPYSERAHEMFERAFR
jgi:hypothetical protein